MTTRDINKLNIRRNMPNNMSIGEKNAITTLTNQTHLTTKPADKGGNIVIMTKSQYKIMCSKIFKNNKL